jgi:hypothetical protein
VYSPVHMTDFLEEKKKEINARLKELRPLVDEYHRLEAAAAALDGVGANSGAATATRASGGGTTTRRARGASGGGRGSGGGGGGTGRRGRPRGSGTRSKQALELVRTRPGISIPEMAEAMGIQQNYLYRVLPGLQKDGLVRKEGRGWHPREAA